MFCSRLVSRAPLTVLILSIDQLIDSSFTLTAISKEGGAYGRLECEWSLSIGRDKQQAASLTTCFIFTWVNKRRTEEKFGFTHNAIFLSISRNNAALKNIK